MKSFNPLPTPTNFETSAEASSQRQAIDQNRSVRLRNFCAKPLAVLLLLLISLLGFTPTASAHNLDQTDTSISFDEATLTLDPMAARAGANQLSPLGGPSASFLNPRLPRNWLGARVGWYPLSLATEILHSV